MKDSKKDNNSWLFKWEFNRYNFTDIDTEYKNSNKTIDINYGHYYNDTKENRHKLETKKPTTEIKENDDIYIYFTNIPGASNQIYLKAYDLSFGENGKYYYYKRDDNDKAGHPGQLQKYIKARKFKWILDDSDRFRFTKDGIIKNYDSCIEDRPLVQKITNNNLIKDLNHNQHSYGEMITELKKIDRCIFSTKYAKPANHEPFTKRQNTPYIEQHHFVKQEIYYNFIKKYPNKKEILKKLIYSPDNIVLLCPRCHEQLHHGLEIDVINMINILIDSKPNLLKNTKEIAKILGLSYIDLISNMYEINFVRK